MRAALTVLPAALLLSISVVSGPRAQAQEPGSGAPVSLESYVYSSRPVSSSGENSAPDKIYIEIRNYDKQITCVKKTVSPKNIETIEMGMKKDGSFESGSRTDTDAAGFIDKIWSDSGTIYCGGPTLISRIKQFKPGFGKLFAVDFSLLQMLRSFPLDKEVAWEIFMVDFSKNSVTVTARVSGEEHVLVPAGEYDCYRVEVTVDLPLIRPRITYWLSKEQPHFLVKHLGKLGPFSRRRVTELLEAKFENGAAETQGAP